MTTEIYIENNRVDVPNEIQALLNMALDDVRNFAERSTSWSKTIVLPGTAVNNKIFGHIFEVGQANEYNPLSANVGYNFNASKSAACLIFQDNLQTFKGVLRLLQINIDGPRVEYEVSVFGEVAGLNVALSSGLLENLDFSEYDSVYDETAVVNSWDNAPGSGIYYPLIDYGTYSTNKHDWDIRTFRPALYVKEYIDKMFAAAGYRYESDLFESDRFKRLIVPHNQKNIQTLSSNVMLATIGSTPQTPSLFASLSFDSISATNFTQTLSGIEYTGLDTIIIDIFAQIFVQFDMTTDAPALEVKLRHNGTPLQSYSLPTTGFPQSFDLNFNQADITIVTGDVIDIYFEASVVPTSYSISVSNSSMYFALDAPTYVNVNPGDDLVVNYTIPKNVRQVDFLVSLVRLFNLYVYEDRFDERLIYIRPYVDFYSTSSEGAIDWTYKLNRSKVITIKPMSEINAKIYEFKLKQDSDYYNELYRKRYGTGYGDRIYDSQFEFAEQKASFDTVFSATPLVGYVGEDKVYSTIFKRTGPDNAPVEELTDSNIRLLQTKKITGVTSWTIKDGVTVLDTLTDYGYAGHLDDPDAPSNDLNFGIPAELFFVVAGGDLSPNQFNVYWSAYMAEITDKDSKLLSARFYLTPADIFNLDFSKLIMVDGVLFRLNKISDYNMGAPSDCGVELLKVNYLIY